MESIFVPILEQALQAGWTVIIVLLLRPLLKKAPGWCKELLWGIVGIRAVLPFSLESALSLMPPRNTAQTALAPLLQQPAEFLPYGGEAAEEAVTVMPVYGVLPSGGISLYALGGWIWAAGFAGVLLISLVRFFRLKKTLTESVLLKENVYLCDHVGSPFILGILRPKIYLPSTLSEAEQVTVLRHEQAHLDRKDHWIKPFSFLLTALFWFHPLLWVAYFGFCRDLEAACDERALKNADSNERKAYTRLLLSFGCGRKIFLYQPLAFGESNVKRRIKNIVSYKKCTFWVAVGAILLCLAAGVCLLTDPVGDKNFDLEDIAQMNIGAEMPRLLYGDDTKVIISGTFGILQYDVEEGEILHRVPMKKLKKVSVLSAYANRNGTKVFITDYVGEPVYQYDTKTFRLTPFKGKYEPAYVPATVNQSVQMDAVGLYSDTYIETGDYNYYLIAANDWRMATLKLMKQAGDIVSVMPIFPPSTDRQETAIRQAIIEHCKSDEAHRNFCAESHRVYHVERAYDAQGNLSGWTAYLLVNYAEERLVNGFYTNQWGRLSPIALTFKTDIAGNHALTEFWEPRDGSEYEPSIREKFPFEYQEDALRMEGRTELSRRVEQALKKKRKADEKGWSHE